MTVRAWHICATCYYFNTGAGSAHYCGVGPDIVYVDIWPERRGCSLWRCCGCFSDVDDDLDHFDCITTLEVVHSVTK